MSSGVCRNGTSAQISSLASCRKTATGAGPFQASNEPRNLKSKIINMLHSANIKIFARVWPLSIVCRPGETWPAWHERRRIGNMYITVQPVKRLERHCARAYVIFVRGEPMLPIAPSRPSPKVRLPLHLERAGMSAIRTDGFLLEGNDK